MNKLFLYCFVFLLTLSSYGQKVYFIYLQSEHEQPFFVKMNEKVYPSNTAGYLILSKLQDSSYTFSIGLPNQRLAEKKYTVDMKSSDHGYLLKNFGEKGWGLFDLQTFSIQMGEGPKESASLRTEKKEVSPFTDILARASDDPSLREKTIMIVKAEEKPAPKPVETVQKEVAKPAAVEPAIVRTVVPEVKKDTIEAKIPEVTEVTKGKIGETIAPRTEPNEKVADKSIQEEASRVKAGEVGTNKIENAEKVSAKPVPVEEVTMGKIGEGGNEGMVKNEKVESKKVIEPASKEKSSESTEKVTLNTQKPGVKNNQEKQETEYKPSTVTRHSTSTTSEGLGITFVDEMGADKDTISIVIPDPKPAVVPVQSGKTERKFLDIDSDTSVKSKPVTTSTKEPVVTKNTKVEKPLETISKKQNCREFANETDFLKLRKKMAAETDDDDMVDEARKYMKAKCFTTVQIKNLGALFLDDLGKYKFFDMAYVFSSDPEQFHVLASELKNDYYINRFKAMLRN